MKNTTRSCPLLLVAFVITLVTCLGAVSTTTALVVGLRGSVNTGEGTQAESPKDPCWFMALKDKSITYEMIKKRQDLEMYGYPVEVALSEAIRVFNEEKQCSSLLAQYPPLTEDELIAAIVAGPDYGKQGEVWRAQKDALWKIASQKVLPKGSLLVAEAGYRVQESPLRPNGTIEAKGIRITLLLGLENHRHGELLNPAQTLVLRKTYSKVETVK